MTTTPNTDAGATTQAGTRRRNRRLTLPILTRARRLHFAAVLLVALLGVGVQPALAASFAVYQPSDQAYASKVDFAVKCVPRQVRSDDPIVYPGQPDVSHSHMFSGNYSTNAYSTPMSLVASTSTTCAMKRNRSAYWMPSLYNDGVRVQPYESRAYYRAGTYAGSSVRPIPFGLKMIAGNGSATAWQSSSIAGFQCRSLASGNTVSKQPSPPRCAVGDFLEASVVFPNCWDGVHLDSLDHKSHLVYAAATAVCPADHPVRLPQLTFAERFPVDSTRGVITLASHGTGNSDMTLHSDYLGAWDPAVMSYLVNACIHKGIACEDVSENRLPPGTTLPPAEWPTT